MNFLFKLSLIPSTIGGVILIYKTYFGVPIYRGEEDLNGKVVILTGASSGIGKELAFQLAQKNATIIMACRNLKECKIKRTKIFAKTRNRNIFCSELDLNNLNSVKNFVLRLTKKIDKVDIIIHNAAVKNGNLRHISNDNIEQQMAINVMAPYLLNKLLQPFLNDNARVITLICPQYLKGSINIQDPNSETIYDRQKSFYQSQLMRILLSNYLSSKKDGVCYITCDPGPTNSPFHKNESYNNNFISRNIFKCINLMILRNIWQAASTPLMCCCSPSVVNGGHYRDLECLPIDLVAMDENMMRYVDSLCNKWTLKFNVKNI